jgi:hypothetical protein
MAHVGTYRAEGRERKVLVEWIGADTLYVIDHAGSDERLVERLPLTIPHPGCGDGCEVVERERLEAEACWIARDYLRGAWRTGAPLTSVGFDREQAADTDERIAA